MNQKRTRRLGVRRLVALIPSLGLGGALAWLAGTHESARGQEAIPENAVPRTYLTKPLVNLPIEIEPAYRTHVSSLALYMKEGAQGSWTLKERGTPAQNSFTFRAPRDGEYWFRIVAIDNQGKAHPEDLNKDVHESVVVVIDSVAPAVDLVYHGSTPEGQITQCELRDANPDMLKLRYYYQTRDQIWRVLEAQPNRPDVFCIPAQAALTNLVKVTAVDFAGNTTTRNFNLGELAAAQAARTNKTIPVPQAAIAPAPLPPAMAQAPQVPVAPPPAPVMPATLPPAPAMVQAQPAPIPATPAPAPGANVVREPDLGLPPIPSVETAAQPREMPFQRQAANPPVRDVAAPMPHVTSAGPNLDVPGRPMTPIETTSPDLQTVSAGTLSKLPANVQVVNTPHVFLNYTLENVGASGVGKVEIWATSDRGQTWSRLTDDAQRKTPAEVRLSGEGLFGLKMVCSNGRGFGGQAPQANDPADWWIEVDASKPKANLTGIRNGSEAESGAIYVLWQAEDKNLAVEPVELFYAAQREGPWSPIAKGLKNDGQYRWVPPADAGTQAFLRLLVRDKAGNVALSETTQPVPLDDQSRPRVRLLNITTTPAPLSSSSSAPTSPGAIVPVSSTTVEVQPAVPTTPATVDR